MHVMVRTPEGARVEKVYLDGARVTSAVEANDEEGWIIRWATEEEIERLVTGPGLIWPKDQDVLIQRRGNVRIELREYDG